MKAEIAVLMHPEERVDAADVHTEDVGSSIL
jgi:hypothetical protein